MLGTPTLHNQRILKTCQLLLHPTQWTSRSSLFWIIGQDKKSLAESTSLKQNLGYELFRKQIHKKSRSESKLVSKPTDVNIV